SCSPLPRLLPLPPLSPSLPFSYSLLLFAQHLPRHQCRLPVVLAFQNPHLAPTPSTLYRKQSHRAPRLQQEQLLLRDQDRNAHVIPKFPQPPPFLKALLIHRRDYALPARLRRQHKRLSRQGTPALRHRPGRFLGRFHFSQKPVASARQCLDVLRPDCIVAQRLPQLLDRRIQAVLEIHKRVRRPDPRAQFLACHHFSCLLEQRRQHLHRLLLHFAFLPALIQLARANVGHIGPKSIHGFRFFCRTHRSLPILGNIANSPFLAYHFPLC